MLRTLPESPAKVRSQSILFDNRNSMAFTGGVMKPEEKNDRLDYVEYDKLMSFETDTVYFQRRMQEEMKLLNSHPNNLKLLTRVGDLYAANHKLDKAKIFYNRAFRADLSNLSVAKRLVEVLLAKGKPEQADGVLQLVDTDFDYNTTHLHAVIKLIQNKDDEAEQLVKKIPTSAKNYFEAINSLGLIMLNRQKNEEAKKCFEKSITAKPDYAPAKSNLALSLQRLGRITPAIVQYKKTIKEHHDYVVAYHNLFNLYVKKEQIENAFKLMDSARDLITPTNEIQFRIAWSLMQLERFEEAIVEYEKVLDLLPDNPNTLNNIGHCYYNLGDMEAAYSYFDRATKSTQKDGAVSVMPYRNLMVLSERVRKNKDAHRIANDILNKFPNDPYALVYKGDELAVQEDWEGALKVLTKAYESKPPLITLYITLSQIYADVFPDFIKGIEVCEYVLDNKINDYGEIVNNYVHLMLVNGHAEKVKSLIKGLNEKNPVSLSTIALYKLQSGKIKEAIANYDKAAEMSEGFAPFVRQRKYYDLALYYFDKEKYKLAKDNFELCIENSEKAHKFIKESAEEYLEIASANS